MVFRVAEIVEFALKCSSLQSLFERSCSAGMNDRCWAEVQKKPDSNLAVIRSQDASIYSTSLPAFHQLCSMSSVFCRLWLQHAGQVFSAPTPPPPFTWELCSLRMNLRRLCLYPRKRREWVRVRDREDRGEPVYRNCKYIPPTNTFSCLHLKLFPKSQCLLQESGFRCPYWVSTSIINLNLCV